MSGAQLTDGEDGDTVSGRCTECGATWIAFDRDEYNHRANRHASREHSGAVQIEEFELLGGGGDG